MEIISLTWLCVLRGVFLANHLASTDKLNQNNEYAENTIEWLREKPNKFHNYETEKITYKASDVAEYLELFGSSTQDRHARRIQCYSLNIRRYMRRHAWRSQVEEPNNLI